MYIVCSSEASGEFWLDFLHAFCVNMYITLNLQRVVFINKVRILTGGWFGSSCSFKFKFNFLHNPQEKECEI